MSDETDSSLADALSVFINIFCRQRYAEGNPVVVSELVGSLLSVINGCIRQCPPEAQSVLVEASRQALDTMLAGVRPEGSALN